MANGFLGQQPNFLQPGNFLTPEQLAQPVPGRIQPQDAPGPGGFQQPQGFLGSLGQAFRGENQLFNTGLGIATASGGFGEAIQKGILGGANIRRQQEQDVLNRQEQEARIAGLVSPQETFTPVLGPGGQVIGQRSTTTGKVVSDPRAQDDPLIVDLQRARQRAASVGNQGLADEISGQIDALGASQTFDPRLTPGAGPVADRPADLGIPRVDPTEAAGIGGLLKNAVNVVGDAFGAGQAFPEAEEARNALKTINTATVLRLTADINGRPPVFSQEQVAALTPKPNEILTGGERVRGQLQQLQGFVSSEIRRLDSLLADPSLLSPTDVSAIRQRRAELDQLIGSYDDLLSSVGGGEDVDLNQFFRNP